MDVAKIKELIELMTETGVSELEVSSGGDAVRIVRPLASAAPAAADAPAPARAAQQGAPIRAPMAGTFYAAPEPGAEPFVREGQSVASGEVLGIIESMKMMNEIVADRSGTRVAVVARNGEPVRAGDVLLRLA
jgi:acetyl-CoA carboxylase biotin carboxyl carrier protein